MSSIPAPAIPVSREELIACLTGMQALAIAFEDAVNELPATYRAAVRNRVAMLVLARGLCTGIHPMTDAVLIRCQQEQEA